MNDIAKLKFPTEYNIHLIARVKAKWGISYAALAIYLGVSLAQSREWSEHDNAPEKIKNKVIRLDDILEIIMKQQNILGIDSTYVQALKHEIELDRKEIDKRKGDVDCWLRVNQAIGRELGNYRKASFWQRLRYLFFRDAIKQEFYGVLK